MSKETRTLLSVASLGTKVLKRHDGHVSAGSNQVSLSIEVQTTSKFRKTVAGPAGFGLVVQIGS